MKDVEAKTCEAIIRLLKGRQELQNFTFRKQSSEAAIKNADVIVSAKRGAEAVLYSGVYTVTATVTLQMRVEKRGKAPDAFETAKGAISEVFQQLGTGFRGENAMTVARQLSAATSSFTCYDFVLSDVDSTPEATGHKVVWTLNLDAMPYTEAQAPVIRTQH